MPTPDTPRDAVRSALHSIGLPAAAARTFLLHYDRFVSGERGRLGRDEIRPVDALPDAEDLASRRRAGRDALPRTVVIKLNGGLGTSMGLEAAKSLLTVRDGLSFLDLICRQLVALRRSSGTPVPLVLMNSFRTEQDSLEVLERYPELRHDEVPSSFLQHRAPKILASSLRPATEAAAGELAWCPPGHGDLYTALHTSGVLDRLLTGGYRYAFVSNADNLGAVLDLDLLGELAETGADLLLEAADRTPADRKGGHLARLADGRLTLRESAQCPPEESDEFQDVARYRYFNTNNLWLNLPSLRERLDRADGVLALPTLVNRKHLDPRDPSSPPVVQLETAMGAAVSVFRRSAAVRVPRRRFSPVKTTSDLLAVRSDAYRLEEDGRVTLHPDREEPPTVVLDERYYTLIDEFERRFPGGPPSLRECARLEVVGDVAFAEGVRVHGEARVVAGAAPATLEPGAVLAGEVRLDDRRC